MNETLIRALSGAVYVAVLIFCTLFSPLSFHVLFTLFMCMAIVEFSNLSNFKYPYLFCFGASLFSVVIYITESLPNQYIYIAGGSVVFSLLLLFNLFKNISFTKYNKPYNHLFLYIIVPFLLMLTIPSFLKPFEYKIIVAIFVLIWSNDTFAYIIGKSFGKTKLFERVSPKKTIEGFVGGLIFTLLTSYILSLYFNFFSLNLWLLTALFVSIFGTLGDLIESQFKREAGLKDSGNIMPGHGGVLDRLDSVIFTTPFIYILYLIYFNYYA